MSSEGNAVQHNHAVQSRFLNTHWMAENDATERAKVKTLTLVIVAYACQHCDSTLLITRLSDEMSGENGSMRT